MDELESRLRRELGSTGRTVAASDALDGAVRRRVRRRQTAAGALAALPVALLAVGALWVLDTSDDAADVDTFRPAPTTLVAPPTDPPAEPIDDPLRRALEDLGVDLDGAPPGTTTLDGAAWCGVDPVFDDPNVEARQCLWAAWQARTPAVGVLVFDTIEGDPIVEVQRMHPDGYIVRWVDATHDENGSGTWDGPVYCSEFDVVDGEPLGANDCDRSLPEPADATTDSGVVASLAPGESVTTQWPDQRFFFDGAESMQLYLLGEADAENGTRRWSAAGRATRNADGTSTLTIVGPSTAAELVAPFDFAPASFVSVEPGVYELAAGVTTSAGGSLVRSQGRPVLVEITADAASDWVPENIAVDSETAILASDGLAGLSWGTAADQALGRLGEVFGPVRRDEVETGCPTERVVEFEAITVWFAVETPDGLVDPSGAGLSGYRYISDARGVFTTPEGIRIGSHLGEVQQTGGSANGPYDGGWGAVGWYDDDRLGGTLSYDMTDPNARVETITAGAPGNPARMVC